MRDISLYMLDIAENSVQAGATEITVELIVGEEEIELIVSDNGTGMKRSVLKKAVDPFFSTKGKVTGLGLSFLKQRTEMCDGHLQINSKFKKGTKVYASFGRKHINCPPLGRVDKTFAVLLSENGIDITFKFDFREGKYVFKSNEFFKSTEKRNALKLKEAEKEIARNIQTILGGVFI